MGLKMNDDDLYVANGQELGDYLDWMFGAKDKDEDTDQHEDD